jgi:anti-sigma factor RsiW
MKCAQVIPYLPGHAGGELRPETDRIVIEHLANCARCTADAGRLTNVRTQLAALGAREVEPPPFLLDAILESTAERGRRRILVPIVPLPAGELVRIVSEHRETIASTAGAVLVAAGAAYALWHAIRGPRPVVATS